MHAVKEGILECQYHFIPRVHLMFQQTIPDFNSGQLMEYSIDLLTAMLKISRMPHCLMIEGLH